MRSLPAVKAALHRPDQHHLLLSVRPLERPEEQDVSVGLTNLVAVVIVADSDYR